MKNIEFNKTFVFTTIFAVTGFISWSLLQPCWQQFRQLTNLKNEFYEARATQPPLSSDVVPNLDRGGMVFDLINLDVRNGITSDAVAMQARKNVSLYLDHVKKECHTNLTDAENERFVACAGRTISKHFYYYPGSAVTSHYADQNTDCDANTYLMMTAAAQAGLKSWIVYAPGHAFFAWKDSFGNYRYWETTANNNRGKWADFRESLYRKAISPAYYRPRDSGYASLLYQSIIYSDSSDRTALDTSLVPLLDNHFVSDILLYYKARNGKLTDSDVRSLKSGLQEDFTSTDRTWALARYYLDHDDKAKATYYLSRIEPGRCRTSCVELLAETSTYNRVRTLGYKMLDSFYDKHGAFLSLEAYSSVMPGLFFGLIAIGFGAAALISALITPSQKKKLAAPQETLRIEEKDKT